MPLPTRVPCVPCGEDTLHVWDADARGWRCNNRSCRNLLQARLEPTTWDNVVQKTFYPPDKARRGAINKLGDPHGRPTKKPSWSVKHDQARKTRIDQSIAKQVGRLVGVVREGDDTVVDGPDGQHVEVDSGGLRTALRSDGPTAVEAADSHAERDNATEPAEDLT